MMPIHDREQAIQTVNRVRRGMAVYYSNPENGPFDGSRDDYFDAENERIVDALSIGQPDPEVERLTAQVAELENELYGPEGIRTGQVGHLNDALRIQAERAEWGEERLQAIERAAETVIKVYYEAKTDREEVLRRVMSALRAVLSEQEEL